MSTQFPAHAFRQLLRQIHDLHEFATGLVVRSHPVTASHVGAKPARKPLAHGTKHSADHVPQRRN